MHTNLIMIRGLPGSGKSTLASELLLKNYRVAPQVQWFEADHYFLITRSDGTQKYVFDPAKLYEAHDSCENNTRIFLSNGHSVIVSNTFTRYREMKPYFDMVQEIQEKIQSIIDLKIVECTGKYGNIHGCPQKILDNMAKRWIPDHALCDVIASHYLDIMPQMVHADQLGTGALCYTQLDGSCIGGQKHGLLPCMHDK